MNSPPKITLHFDGELLPPAEIAAVLLGAEAALAWPAIEHLSSENEELSKSFQRYLAQHYSPLLNDLLLQPRYRYLLPNPPDAVLPQIAEFLEHRQGFGSKHFAASDFVGWLHAEYGCGLFRTTSFGDYGSWETTLELVGFASVLALGQPDAATIIEKGCGLLKAWWSRTKWPTRDPLGSAPEIGPELSTAMQQFNDVTITKKGCDFEMRFKR